MKKAKQLKKKYGTRYLFRKYLTDRQIDRLKTEVKLSGTDMTAASLEIGCIRLDAVLFRSSIGTELAYDVLVRDTLDSLEWICYDSIPAKSVKENDMAGTLDSYIRAHSLTYEDCRFVRLDGKIIKSGKALK